MTRFQSVLNRVNLCLKLINSSPYQFLHSPALPLLHLTGCPAMGCRPDAGAAIQLPLPLQPVRATWWQPTLWTHVARVRIVRNVKQGAHPDLLHPHCGVRAGRRFCVASWVHGYLYPFLIICCGMMGIHY